MEGVKLEEHWMIPPKISVIHLHHGHERFPQPAIEDRSMGEKKTHVGLSHGASNKGADGSTEFPRSDVQ